jgi:hypothetical protein
MRVFITSALFFLTLAADAQILTPGAPDRFDDRRDPYYRNNPYSRNDPYYDRDRDVRRERRRGDSDYGRRSGYGYGDSSGYGYGGGYSSDPLSIASRIMSDVRLVASNNYGMEKRDRKDVEEVEEELGKFSRKYREGKFDKNNLKDASESLQSLVRSSSIRSSRDRRILSDSLIAVEELRSGRYDAYSRSRR